MTEVVRSTILVIHQDGEALDRLTRLFEGRGYDVVTAATQFQANARLDGERTIDVVVAQWDDTHALGGEVYRWVVPNRPRLRGQFVFLAAGPPAEFHSLVGGRCLLVHPDDHAELFRVTEAATRRSHRIAGAAAGGGGSPQAGGLAAGASERPRLLLVDDEALMLHVMSAWFTDMGFAVTPASGGNAAIAQLELGDHDVILTGWVMEDGSGAELIRWIEANRPTHVDRIAILAESRLDQIRAVLPEIPVFARGQDADVLVTVLRQIAGKG